MTAIYELSRHHAAAGGETTVVLQDGATAGYESYPVGTVVEVGLGALPGRWAKRLDGLRGAVGLRRRAVLSTYAASVHAVAADLDGYVFVHNAPGVIPWLVHTRSSVPICLYAHNALFGTYTRREARRIVDAAYRVISLSDYLAEDLRQRIGRDDTERIRTVRDGVDSDIFVPQAADSLRQPPVVLFVGRVIPEKGVDLLIRAALLLRESGTPLRLRIVGSSGFSATDPLSPYEQRLREIAAPLGRLIEFLPFQERGLVPGIYQDADVFCAPSNWEEPLCLCVLEAMASGLPCVVSRRGGIPELGGDAVMYFQPPDYIELARALERLLTSRETRRGLGAIARQRAENHSWAQSYRSLTAALLS